MKNDPVILAAQQFIRSNQDRIPNTPWAQQAVSAIMNGDAATGAQIANNLCSSYGTTPMNAVQMAIQRFSGRRQ